MHELIRIFSIITELFGYRIETGHDVDGSRYASFPLLIETAVREICMGKK